VTENVGATGVARQHISTDENQRASRHWWDIDADNYQAEHGAFLGEVDFVWCPEGLREADAHLLGPVAGARVLEVGCGAAAAGRWLVTQGADVVAVDLSSGMLRHAVAAAAATGVRPALLQCDALALPLRDASIDIAFTAFGAVPFIDDSARVMRQVFRVLRPGGRWVFSATHPMRWIFLDDPGPDGLVATHSYFDRRPYVEYDPHGQAVYVEHHRTLGDRIRELVAAGFVIEEPDRAGVARGSRRALGPVEPVARCTLPRHRHLRVPEARLDPHRTVHGPQTLVRSGPTVGTGGRCDSRDVSLASGRPGRPRQ
jgi:SAM-dependent methyltransferase